VAIVFGGSRWRPQAGSYRSVTDVTLDALVCGLFWEPLRVVSSSQPDGSGGVSAEQRTIADVAADHGEGPGRSPAGTAWRRLDRVEADSARRQGLRAVSIPTAASWWAAALVKLRRLGIVAAQPITRVAPQVATLEAYRDQIATWLDDDPLLLTRVQELLGQYGVPVKYTTLRRYVRQAGLWKQPRSTVRMAPTAPGEVAEMDFGKLGTLINPVTGQRQVVWGLLVVLVYSRYSFFWPLVQQTVEATIEGLEKAWGFLRRSARPLDHGQLSGRSGWARRTQPASDARLRGVQPGARSDPGPCSRSGSA
jgi:hypothetical protein